MPTQEQYRLAKVLRKLQIFGKLSEAEALQILGMCQRKAFAETEVVWNPGDQGADMLILLTGKLLVRSDKGRVVGQVLPGGSFGEMACLTGQPRYVGFEAALASTALSLTREALRGLIVKQPTLYVKILETTIQLLARRVTRGHTRGAADDEGDLSLW